jgi:hypothetical protein
MILDLIPGFFAANYPIKMVHGGCPFAFQGNPNHDLRVATRIKGKQAA